MSLPIDLRSDTVTRPTPDMLAAMARADLGDDVYGEDPTVIRLEEIAAEQVGKPAALFVPSGTMGNLCAVLSHCQRGQEAIIGDRSHIFHWEAGGVSVLGGVPFHPIANTANGQLPIADIRRAVRDSNDEHEAPTRLLCLETTHNECGGRVLSLDYLTAARRVADKCGLAIHLDGARLFNAATALAVAPTDITRHVDSLMFCLSKGLCAPVGSILAGSREFIKRARRYRKMLGGGMRQAGVLAAAGIVALQTMTGRLHQDHFHATILASALADIPGVRIDPTRVQSNIVCFDLDRTTGDNPDGGGGISWAAFARVIERVKQQGVLLSTTKRELRAVTHHGVKRSHIDQAIAAIATAVDDLGPSGP